MERTNRKNRLNVQDIPKNSSMYAIVVPLEVRLNGGEKNSKVNENCPIKEDLDVQFERARLCSRTNIS